MQQEDHITVPESLRFSPFITSKGAVIPSDAKHDDVLDAFCKLKRLRQLVSVLVKQYEQEAVGWCMENDSVLALDQENYYYVGVEKKVKCKDVSKAVENVLDVSGGDFSDMVDLLVANPIKHGAYKDYVKSKYMEENGGGEEEADMFSELSWNRYFERKEVDRMKEGKGDGRKLIGVNPKSHRKST